MNQNLVRSLSKLFNIRPDEWPRLLFLYGMVFIALVGFTWGEAIVEAAFLHQVGVQFLPLAIMANAVFSMIGITIYTAFADRVTNDKVLIGLIMPSVMLIIIGLVLLGWGWVTLAFPLLYMVINVPLRDIFNVHWATYTNSFYDNRAAKRIVPVVGSGARVAGIVAGLTMPLLNTFLSLGGIISLWMLAWVGMGVLVWLMPRVLKDNPVPAAHESANAKTGVVQHIREGSLYVAQSPFLRWLAIGTFLLMVLLAFLNVQTGKVLVAELKTTEQIANFTALLNGFSNLIALPFQLFVLSRLIGKTGLGNAALMYPATTSTAAVGLVALPNLVTAGFAYIDRSALRTTLRNPIDNLLSNAVPLRVRARSRAFIGGLIMPAGSLIGGLTLLVAGYFGSAGAVILDGIVIACAVAYLIASWITRKQYAQALVTMLEQEDFSFLLSQEGAEVTVMDTATLNKLKEKLEKPDTSPDITIFIAQLISQAAGKGGLAILTEAARASKDARVRAGIVDILSSSESREPQVRALYKDLLADPDGIVRQASLTGLGQLIASGDKESLALASNLLDDPDTSVRVQVLSILSTAGAMSGLSQASQILEQLLSSADPQERAQGVRVLGKGCSGPSCGDTLGRLLHFLSDTSDEVRLEAAIVTEELAIRRQDIRTQLPAGPSSVECAEPLLHDPVDRIRQAALVIVGRLAAPGKRHLLAGSLADTSPDVRSAAADVLVDMGKAAIPVVHPLLDSQNALLRKMATVVLSRINPREFGGMITGTHITGNLLTVYRNIGRLQALSAYADLAGLNALRSNLREQNQQVTDEILYLLTAVHPAASVKIVADSLRSDDPRTRANAVEALEALTTPQTTSLIAPLFEHEAKPAELMELSRQTWDMQHPDPCGAVFQLSSESDPLVRAMVAYALGELGASVSKEGSGPSSSPLTGLQIQSQLRTLSSDSIEDVRRAAHSALQALQGETRVISKEDTVLSTIEKIIFLKEVPFFQGMTIEQLKVLANVSEEQFHAADTRLFGEGDPSGALYVVVNGKVAIEQEKRKGSFARLSTVESHSYFGEMSLFDNSPHSTSALALQDTVVLRVRREPLIALIRQHPELSLELIKVLNNRLREANARVAELTKTRPRELHKLFDALE